MRRIQLLLDGSESSEVAAKHAIKMASKCDAMIVPVEVIDTRRFRTSKVIETVRTGMDTYLENLAEKAQACCDVTIDAAKTITANPIRDILAETKSSGCDLIVLGASGYTHGTINDIGAAVLREAKKNVLLVRDRLENDRFYQNILMPTSVSESNNTAKHAAEIAGQYGANLVGCSVMNTTDAVQSERIVYLPEAATGRRHLGERVTLSKAAVDMKRHALLNRATRAVDNLLGPARSAGIHTESVVLDGSNPAEKIPSFAAEGDFDLMVLGYRQRRRCSILKMLTSHYRNRGRFSRILTGNLAEDIATRAPCSVFAVKES
jgi:nucleotide-binding universal stress UspA family protein